MDQHTPEEVKAIQTVKQVFSEGYSPEELAGLYDDWSGDYERVSILWCFSVKRL